jgi:hypothetical protein
VCHGRLAAASSHNEFCVISFFALKSNGQKDSTASSPFVSALRAASPIYTLTMVSLFGWLLRHLMPQEPLKFEAPFSLSIFIFFVPQFATQNDGQTWCGARQCGTKILKT